MNIPTCLVATWRDGVFSFTAGTCQEELAGQPIRALTADARGGALAIVQENSLYRRTMEGIWSTVATSKWKLACAVEVGEHIFVGTDDARILRVHANGPMEPLDGFAAVAGRDTWYAGSAVINGRVVGPPLGIRSITATADGEVLLANVHVGGLPRSTDGGLTWQPTIDVDSDVHEVCAHPTDRRIVIAAAAIGLGISRDGGASWSVERAGLHAAYCSAVAFSGDDIFVSASSDHFAKKGAIYRRPIDGSGPLVPVGDGLPIWLDGICDTGCIAAYASAIAVADKGGNLFLSDDSGRTWARRAAGLPAPSSVLLTSHAEDGRLE